MSSSQPCDLHARPLRDLRISVTDACNLRCDYCMPGGRAYKFLDKRDLLSYEEISRLAKLFLRLGVRKIRLTGGEPLLRRGLAQLVAQLTLQAQSDLCLTTNGLLLPKFASELRQAGLQRITVSLDTLDPAEFKRINGGDVGDVLAGIDAAQRAGFENIKLNSVIRADTAEAHIVDLLNFSRENGHILRFIEYMDVGNLNGWKESQVLPAHALIKMIQRHFDLEPLAPSAYGEVAKRYRFRDGRGEFGVISSISEPFCGDCVRARLSAAGIFYTCLFANKGLDLKTPLRDGLDDPGLEQLIAERWRQRSDRYSEERAFRSSKTSPKVEMYHVGG